MLATISMRHALLHACHALQQVALAVSPARVAMPSSVQRTGYMGFGSFMTDQSVEEMISEPEDVYRPPTNPCEADCEASTSTPLGADCRHLFMIDFDTWTFINHGAFGGVCKPAHQEAQRWREHAESQPLQFLDRQLFPQLVRVIREMAAYVGARPQDLVFVPNATTGLNTVIQGIGLQPGDALFMLDIGYGSVKKMAAAACGAAEAVYGHVTFPISGPEAILEVVRSSMPPNTKLAVFDAVTSNTAVVLPVQELVQLCRERGVAVLIDGAHALGQLDLDLQSLGADFYVTNCHKWFAAPRGSALMWVAPKHQELRPLVVSHGWGSGFSSNFAWDGCRDYAPYLATSACLRMWRALGPERCRSYCRQLLADAVQLLTQRWGTGTLVPLSMCGFMALVRLPADCAQATPATSADAKYIQDVLHHAHRVECPVKCIQGVLYVRISAFVYNTLVDYETLGKAVDAIVVHIRQQG